MPSMETPWVKPIDAASAPLNGQRSTKPEPFRSRYDKREKRPLGDIFGLRNFGVNLTRLPPGAESALLHRHSHQDEFVYVLEGEPTLVTSEDEMTLQAGMCAGFPHGGVAHQFVNRTDADVLLLEIGDRAPGDKADFPGDDLEAVQGPNGKWHFVHKDGTPY